MLPTLPFYTSKNEIETFKFLGINHTENTQEGEMSDSYGITLDSYPCVRTRRGREKIEKYKSPSDIFEFDSHVAVVDSGILYFDDEALANVTSQRKQWTAVNRLIVVFPDKIWINADTGEFGNLNARTISQSGININGNTVTAQIKPIHKTGLESESFNAVTSDNDSVNRTYKGFYTYTSDDVEKHFFDGEWDLSSVTSEWHNAINFPKSGDIFIPSLNGNTFSVVTSESESEYDISKYNSEGYYGIITEVTSSAQAIANLIIYDMTFNYDVYRVGEGSPQFSSVFEVGQTVTVTTDKGILAAKTKITDINDENNSITFEKLETIDGVTSLIIERSVPDLDFICERENRLWGVSNADRTVYASALGEPAEFWTYDSVSTDSYAVAIGSEGEFTGICSYNGATVIFKEKQIYKILGSYPEEFYMLDYQMPGVQKGCERSIAIVDETLIYKGLYGIYALTSGTPKLLSYNLGNTHTTDAVATYDGRNYVISMKNENGGVTYSYELKHGLWVKTDNEYMTAMCTVNNTLYLLLNGEVYKEADSVENVEWMLELVPTCERSFYHKIYTKLFICAEMEENSTFEVQIRLDNGEWKNVWHTVAAEFKPLTVPLLLPRAHRLQIRMLGTGNVLIRQLSREFHAGGVK